ncbi:DoxX family protein [Fodinibius saliphilus]|uniref:DoxX family protein n=1 Tax=Fodinibius saliphilus TaxID=1920650 RepID=UPI001108C766|nr:DoxX family protein [Fodinibius saliphilus]
MLNRLNSSTLSEFVDAKTSAAILRIFAAFFMFYGHGWGKLMTVFSGDFPSGFDPIGIGPELSMILAALAEGVCSILVIVGFWTRLAAAILVINMSVAVFAYHIPAGDGFGGMESALFYLCVFGVIFLFGPGKYSIDSSK